MLGVNSDQLPPKESVSGCLRSLTQRVGGRFAHAAARTYVVGPSLAAISRAVATMEVSIPQAETPWRSEIIGLARFDWLVGV